VPAWHLAKYVYSAILEFCIINKSKVVRIRHRFPALLTFTQILHRFSLCWANYSDVLNMESLEYKLETTDGDCKANSTSATAGDSFRSIDCTEVNFCSLCFYAILEKWVPYSQRYLVLGLVGLGLPLLLQLGLVGLALSRISPRVRVRVSISIVLGLASGGYSWIWP